MIKILLLALTAVFCLAVPSDIQRPCYLNDLRCIGDNLAANSQCSRAVSGRIPSQYLVPRYRYETPYFKSSYIDNNLVIRNHDRCGVSEFYLNKATDKGVLALECRNLNFESDRTLIQHGTGVEDTEFRYHINGTYPLIRVTVTLNHADRMDLCQEWAYAEVPVLPVFKIDPLDQPTKSFLTRELSELLIYEVETFAYRGQEIIGEYINNLICNFNCKTF